MLTQVLADAHKFSSHVQWSNRVVKYESVTQQWRSGKRKKCINFIIFCNRVEVFGSAFVHYPSCLTTEACVAFTTT